MLVRMLMFVILLLYNFSSSLFFILELKKQDMRWTTFMLYTWILFLTSIITVYNIRAAAKPSPGQSRPVLPTDGHVQLTVKDKRKQ